MKKQPLPEIGRLVEVVRGRDRGLVALVVGHEADRFVRIADGSVRKVDRPKKKNALHVLSLPQIAAEIAEALRENGKITNANIRYALRRYRAQMADDEAAPGETRQDGADDVREGDALHG